MNYTLRPAQAADADALTRLHVQAGTGTAVPEAWTRTHTRDLARRLAADDPCLIAYVVEAPGEPDPLCAAVGFVQATLSRPDNPTGRTAHLASLVTSRAHRRRSYARAALLAWLAEAAARHCTAVTLTASDAGRSLYRSLDFEAAPNSMRLTLPSSSASTAPLFPEQPLEAARATGSSPPLTRPSAESCHRRQSVISTCGQGAS